MYNEKVKKKKKRGKEMNTGKENAKSIGTVRERERERELHFSKRKSSFVQQPDTHTLCLPNK